MNVGETIREKMHAGGELIRENPGLRRIPRAKGEAFQEREWGKSKGSAAAAHRFPWRWAGTVSFFRTNSATASAAKRPAQLSGRVSVFRSDCWRPKPPHTRKLVITFVVSHI